MKSGGVFGILPEVRKNMGWLGKTRLELLLMNPVYRKNASAGKADHSGTYPDTARHDRRDFDESVESRRTVTASYVALCFADFGTTPETQFVKESFDVINSKLVEKLGWELEKAAVICASETGHCHRLMWPRHSVVRFLRALPFSAALFAKKQCPPIVHAYAW